MQSGMVWMDTRGQNRREETIGPCPCPRWGHPWRLNTFITKSSSSRPKHETKQAYSHIDRSLV